MSDRYIVIDREDIEKHLSARAASWIEVALKTIDASRKEQGIRKDKLMVIRISNDALTESELDKVAELSNVSINSIIKTVLEKRKLNKNV